MNKWFNIQKNKEQNCPDSYNLDFVDQGSLFFKFLSSLNCTYCPFSTTLTGSEMNLHQNSQKNISVLHYLSNFSKKNNYFLVYILVNAVRSINTNINI